MSDKHLQMEELDALFAEQVDELFVYLAALSHDRELAKDLVQNVLVKFVEQVAAGRILRETARNYLKTMCRNEFYGHKRRESKEAPLPGDWMPAQDPAREKIETYSRRIHIVLIEALSAPEMPREIAEVLRLRLLLKRDFNSICKKLNKSRSTVHRLMKRGVQLLQLAFQEAGLSVEEVES